MSGFTLRTTPTTPQIREWFGTSGADRGLNFSLINLTIGSQDIAYGYGGNDTIDAGLSPSAVIFGGQGNDSLVGSPIFLAISILSGDRGADTLISQGGSVSSLLGGADNDSLLGANTTGIVESLWGGQGADTARGQDGNDFLSGDVGADIIWGDDGNSAAAGNDIILGGTESDTIVGGGGNDSVRGGQGNDYLEVDSALVNSTVPTSDDVVAGNDTVLGDLGNDTIGRFGSALGATGRDWYDGGDGTDSIVGGNQGDATLVNGVSINPAGDTLIGGAGNDTIRGGNQNSGADSITGGDGDDALLGGNENSNAAGGDTIDGGAGNDNIDGQDGRDSLVGGTGNDFILGAGGNDTVLGSDQNDTLRGADGNDSLIGGRDQDLIEGGRGRDTLIGSNPDLAKGDGVDQFLFDVGEITTTTGLGPANLFLPGPNGNATGIPDALAAGDAGGADFILGFDVNQDRVVITGKTVNNISTTFNPPATAAVTTVNGLTVKFGSTYIDATSGGGFATIGQVFRVGGTAATGTFTINATSGNGNPGGAPDTLIYIERDGLAGFLATGDIAVATLVGVNSDTTLAGTVQII